MGNHNKIRNILAFLLLAASTVLLVVVLSRMTSGPKDVPLSPLPKDIDVSLQRIHYAETKKGKKQWDLDAEKAELDRKKETVDLIHPRLQVYLDKEPRVVVVSGDRALYNIKSRNVSLQGNVCASGGDLRVTTDSLTMETVRNRIVTRDHVTILHGGSSLEGEGMELRTDTGTMTLLKNVSARINPKELRK